MTIKEKLQQSGWTIKEANNTFIGTHKATGNTLEADTISALRKMIYPSNNKSGAYWRRKAKLLEAKAAAELALMFDKNNPEKKAAFIEALKNYELFLYGTFTPPLIIRV